MNREIKFRGLRIDTKEWVYGCLVNNLWCYSVNSPYKGKKVCEIITSDQFSADDYEEMQANGMNVTVDPDSVAQFTGRLDKNGTEIYEGDAIRVAPGYVSVIQYSEKECAFLSVYSHPEDGESLLLGDLDNDIEVISESEVYGG